MAAIADRWRRSRDCSRRDDNQAMARVRVPAGASPWLPNVALDVWVRRSLVHVPIQLSKRQQRFPGALGKAPGERSSIEELQVGDNVRLILRREYYGVRKRQEKARVMSDDVLQRFGGIVVEIGRGVSDAPQGRYLE